MKTAYVFDVDGTLTPSRDVITDEFREFFTTFCEQHLVYLVSGSDHAKTVEQLGEVITNDLTQLVYSCSGNSVWDNGVEIYSDPWTLPVPARNYLIDVRLFSKCPEKTGNHLEARPGSVNFSTVGRNATREQRAEYIEFDNRTGERESIVKTFNTCFGSKLNCTALIGGETGIDITKTGHDKSQILKDFTDMNVIFFGDRCAPGGNDYPLANAILQRFYPADSVFPVSGWQDTMGILTQHC
jgi:phosphomannomutase